jgi:hypothetical protein
LLKNRVNLHAQNQGRISLYEVCSSGSKGNKMSTMAVFETAEYYYKSKNILIWSIDTILHDGKKASNLALIHSTQRITDHSLSWWASQTFSILTQHKGTSWKSLTWKSYKCKNFKIEPDYRFHKTSHCQCSLTTL